MANGQTGSRSNGIHSQMGESIRTHGDPLNGAPEPGRSADWPTDDTPEALVGGGEQQ